MVTASSSTQQTSTSSSSLFVDHHPGGSAAAPLVVDDRAPKALLRSRKRGTSSTHRSSSRLISIVVVLVAVAALDAVFEPPRRMMMVPTVASAFTWTAKVARTLKPTSFVANRGGFGNACHQSAAVARNAEHVFFLTRRYASADTETSTAASSTTSATPDLVNGRLSSHGLSVDVRTIATSLPVFLSHLRGRRASDSTLQAAETISELVSDRNRLIQERDAQLSERKDASAVVAKLLRQQQQQNESESQQQQIVDELENAKARSNQAAEKAAEAEAQLQELEARMDDLLSGIPNLLDDVVPDGDSDQDNPVVSTWGDTKALPQQLGWTDDFQPLWHDDVAAKLGGYQAEEAVKLSGARFVALSGEVAQLERALAMFLMDLHTSPEHGYREVSVPLVVSRSTLEGTSQLPKFQEDLFAITRDSHTCNGEDAFLIPTAEVPVTNLHRGDVLEESDLPISYVAHTPCFRAEAGSYGRDTKGLIRTHQFYKVELVKITTPESSDEQHELLTSHAEACLQALQLPYRKVRLCSGDIGFAARHCYDLEVWLPGAGEYREISSCSNCGDFQARRMALRYRPKPSVDGAKGSKAKKPKPQLCHTINGSGLAVGRTLVAVLENYQRPDGSVVVPEVLRPYMRGKEVLAAPTKSS